LANQKSSATKNKDEYRRFCNEETRPKAHVVDALPEEGYESVALLRPLPF
jgi:hypothetical protein